MTKMIGLTLMTLLMSACVINTGDEFPPPDCAKSLCGCTAQDSQSITLRLSDADGRPVANARLVCHDNGTYLGTTNVQGSLSLEVEGENSPGCGFIPDCQVAYFRNEDNSFGRHFWFARFIRGEDVSAKAQSVELIDKDER